MFKEKIKEYIPYLVIVIVVIVIRTYFFTPIKVNGESMMNTLYDKDTMILNKIGMKFSELKRFDIVVIKVNNNYIIKRIIGLPGETIEYKNGKLYINGKVFKDPYYKDNTDDFIKVEVPNGYYFVMGDNRSDSLDSRIIGPINKDDIKGTTNLVIFPFKNMGIVK
ncbi:MAG: signal peptidase I [Bacilli bacterium]|nr:signal peptidase I [Bacilli bacterium]